MLLSLPFHPSPIDAQQVTAGLHVILCLSLGISFLWLLGNILRASEKSNELPPAGRRHIAFGVFLFVCGLLLLNQVLVNVYILRQHAGSASFVSRYLPRGWFVLATHSTAVKWTHAHLPKALNRFLPYTILRVQAALELPFVISAYLAIVELLSPALRRFLWRSVLLPAALLSFTATFCLIEMALWNPFTISDLRWRVSACILGIILWGLSRLRSRPIAYPTPIGSVERLLLLLCGGGALSAMVLGIYVLTLLYNLGRLSVLGPGLLVCLGISLGAAALSGRLHRSVASPALFGAFGVLHMFSAVFFVPSLAIRYSREQPSAGIAASIAMLLTILGSVAFVLRRRPADRQLLGLGLFLIVGTIVAAADFYFAFGFSWLPTFKMLEARLLRGAFIFLLAGTVAAAAVDRKSS